MHAGDRSRDGLGSGGGGSLSRPRGGSRRRWLAVVTVVALAAAAVSLAAMLVPSSANATPPSPCPGGTEPSADGGPGHCADGRIEAGSMVALDSCHTYARHQVCGLVEERYLRLRGPEGFLGVPTSDERRVGPGEVGRVSHFDGGDIYWSPDSGSWEIHGAVGAKWVATSGQDGPLGFPTSNVVTVNGAEWSSFEHGSVVWSALTGAHTVAGEIDLAWRRLGGPGGPLGLPVTDTSGAYAGRQVSFFQTGTLYWSRDGGLEAYMDSAVPPLVQDAETLFGLPLADFVATRQARSSDGVFDLLDWSSDGCSGGFLTPAPIDDFFHEACLRHDFGYRNFLDGPRIDPTPARKLRIDDVFLADLLATCDAAGQPRVQWRVGISVECTRAARLMYGAVRLVP